MPTTAPQRHGAVPGAGASRRKPSPKQDHLAEQIRRQIVRGQLGPGDRLPTRTQLQRQFDVSSITVQRALDDLARDGFILARGTLGTFVTDRPPHISHYALVFFTHPGLDDWVRFWSVLEQEAVTLGAEAGCRISVFHCTGKPQGAIARHKLERAVASHSLAGMIFSSHPYPLERSPILTAPGIPRVAFMRGEEFPDIHKIAYDQSGFIDQAFGWFKTRKRCQVAILGTPDLLPESADLLTALADHGLSTRPYWLQTVNPATPASALNCVHLLFQDHQAQRPDALLITDDNLVEHAVAGLIAAGVRVPQDLDVVAHCNFPASATTVVPLKRLGYDARQALRLALRLIDGKRQGARIPPVSYVEAVFEPSPPARP